MQMFISSSNVVRSPHQGRLLSLQKVTLYWLPIDPLAAGDVFFFCLFLSVPLCFCLTRSLFMSLIIHLFSNALRHCHVYFVVLFLSFFLHATYHKCHLMFSSHFSSSSTLHLFSFPCTLLPLYIWERLHHKCYYGCHQGQIIVRARDKHTYWFVCECMRLWTLQHFSWEDNGKL